MGLCAKIKLLTVGEIYQGRILGGFHLQSQRLLFRMPLYVAVRVSDREKPHAGEYGHRHLRSRGETARSRAHPIALTALGRIH